MQGQIKLAIFFNVAFTRKKKKKQLSSSFEQFCNLKSHLLPRQGISVKIEKRI